MNGSEKSSVNNASTRCTTRANLNPQKIIPPQQTVNIEISCKRRGHIPLDKMTRQITGRLSYHLHPHIVPKPISVSCIGYL